MSQTTLTVLVLGVGGNVSQGILKAIAISNLRDSCRVIGACVNPLSLGLYTVDRAYVSPSAAAPDFVPWLLDICVREGVQAILSGVEPVLQVLACHAETIVRRTGARPIVGTPAQLAIGEDKLVTCQWLEQHGFNFPRYASADDAQALVALTGTCGYPLIAKPRQGKGSSGVLTIRSEADLAYASRQSNYVVEEYLGDAESEYTAGCFADKGGTVRGTIVMHRELSQGTTYRAEVGEFADIRAEAARITAALRPMGPCNIQLRVSQGRPVCFEVNNRFSGTTPLRARFGFNEVEAALRHYVLNEPAVDLPLVTSGIALRYWNEMYVDPQAAASLRETGHSASPASFSLRVEDYAMRRI